jgi:superfamily II DNA/RNA helicase
LQRLTSSNETALILAPTRELALQIEDALLPFSKITGVKSTVLIGGASMNNQITALRQNPRMLIATPGRLIDLMEQRVVNLSQTKILVLDEADRMLDMGFIRDMKYMMSLLPATKETLFFSATISRDIEILIKDFLKEPISISVKTGDTAKSVDQDVVRVGSRNKIDVLYELLSKADFSRVLIFGQTKHGVERLKNDLVKRGFKSESIHGNKNQSKRQQALDLFKSNHLQVLVATDVAARGLDISNVSHVINYDLPATYEDYIHRIGRTGRAGKAGKAITFIA